MKLPATATTSVAGNPGGQTAGQVVPADAITLTALWDKATGDGHEVCALTHTQQAAQRLRVADGHQYVKRAVGSGEAKTHNVAGAGSCQSQHPQHSTTRTELYGIRVRITGEVTVSALFSPYLSMLRDCKCLTR